MTDMDEIRFKAASAVVSLANRCADKGREQKAPAKGGWVPNGNGFGGFVQPKKLREAVAYYEIAHTIHPEPFAAYTRAMLLEELGDYDAAEQAFVALKGTSYETFGADAAVRCRQHRAGTFNPDAQLDAAFAGLDENGEVDDATVDAMMKKLDAHLGNADTGPDDGEESEDEVEANILALTFVDLLTRRQYAQARKHLHASMKATTAADLREAFEALFEDEELPDGVDVQQVLTDWPGKGPDDIASIYVSLASENAEAVTVLVCREGKRFAIRQIEWGRP